MLILKRLPWVLLGVVIGIASTTAIGIGAQERAVPPPPPPPIPVKFIGIVEQGSRRAAIFSDEKRQPFYANEGEIVLGQYKLLKIGVDSVVMSHLDGTGVQTIPMAGNQRSFPVRPGAASREQDQVLTDHPVSGLTPWKFVSDSRTHSCWLAATTPTGREVTALAPAPPDACR